MLAEAAAEGRLPNATPQDVAAAETVEAEIETVSDELDSTMMALEAEPASTADPVAVSAEVPSVEGGSESDERPATADATTDTPG
jgi:hypothetical protein